MTDIVKIFRKEFHRLGLFIMFIAILLVINPILFEIETVNQSMLTAIGILLFMTSIIFRKKLRLDKIIH